MVTENNVYEVPVKLSITFDKIVVVNAASIEDAESRVKDILKGIKTKDDFISEVLDDEGQVSVTYGKDIVCRKSLL